VSLTSTPLDHGVHNWTVSVAMDASVHQGGGAVNEVSYNWEHGMQRAPTAVMDAASGQA